MRETELATMDEKEWGKYGDEEPCEHILALRDLLIEHKMIIYPESTPDGWVNVACRVCGRTYETILQMKEDVESEED